MSKCIYGPEARALATPTLGKPFVKIKTIEGFLYNEQGDYTQKGKIHLYMDPRGDVEFAIGMHPWMHKLLATGNRYQLAKDRLCVDSYGQMYVLGGTAKAVQKHFREMQNEWSVRAKAVSGRRVISVTFSSSGPVFDAEGVEQKPEGIITESTVRGHSADISIELSVDYGVMADQNGVDRFFRIDEEGALHEVYMRDKNRVFIPDSPENRMRIDNARKAVTQGMDKLAAFFSQPTENWLQQLSGAPLQLEAPAPSRTVKRVRR